MGKKNKSVNRGAQGRVRVNPLTGATESVSGTKAGRKRQRLPIGHELRTHDLHGPVNKRSAPGKKKRKKQED